MNEVLLRINDLYKYFGATHAVDGASMEVYPGEVLGFIGENGSGKSTILSMVSGMLKPDSGNFELDGKPYAPANQAEGIRCGVSLIAQEINTLEGLSVAENIFLGLEKNFSHHGFLNLKKMNQMARDVLAASGITDINPEDDVRLYSIEQRKMIELVRSSFIQPRLLMIDETSTALSHIGRNELYKLIQATKNAGNSVIFISHDLREVLNVCDRITILRDGKIVTSKMAGEVDEDQLKTLMVGRELVGHFYRTDYGSKLSDQVVLQVRDLKCNRLMGVSFDLHKGEILGIAGLSDSGMHEIGKAIFGIEYDVTGDVKVVESGRSVRTIQEAISEKIGYISKNRDTESLFQAAPISDNIAVPCMDVLSNGFFVSPAKMEKFAEEKAVTLEVKMRDIGQNVCELSGGNKQKVAVTKWIARGTEIFVMDSPTRGIDVGVKAVIYDLMVQLNKQGKSMIVISEELLELIGCCDRILVMRDGRISGEFLRDQHLSEEAIIQKMV